MLVFGGTHWIRIIYKVSSVNNYNISLGNMVEDYCILSCSILFYCEWCVSNAIKLIYIYIYIYKMFYDIFLYVL